MNSSQYEKSQLKLLCKDIGTNQETIKYICSNIDDFYRIWTEKKPDKKNGGFKKYKDGTEKVRTITPSLKNLKMIQRKIKDNILAPIKLPAEIHGGVKKRSNVSNAKPHQGNKYQFTTDLQSFFPNITHKQVYQTFIELGFSNHYSHWLTKLTTWQYNLPQGTPTSTHIANLVFLKTDYRLIDLCNANNIVYTRYVDDLTFSSQQCFKNQLEKIIQLVINGGFKISYRKTKYSGNQNITGVDVFNNYIDAPLKIKLKAKEEIELNKEFKPYTNYLNQIKSTNRKKPATNKL